MDLRDWRVFAPVIMAGYVVTRFIGVALHEIAGHGLAATALGGTFYAVFLSPSAGYSLIFMPPSAGAWALVAVNMAGIVVEVVVGLLLLFLLRRIHDPLGTLMALLLLQVLLFQAFMYMALGSWADTGGDTAQVVLLLNSTALLVAFNVIGVALAAFFAFVISRRLVKLLEPSLSLKRLLFVLLFFWLFSFVVDVALGGIPPLPPWQFIVMAVVVAVVGGYIIGRRYRKVLFGLPPAKIEPLGVAKWDLAVLGVAFFVVTATWLAAFGPNPASAHGILIQEPPIESEEQWLGTLAIDMNVFITRTANPSLPVNVSVDFRFRGIPDLQSPLDRQIWATFGDRAYFPMYESMAVLLAKGAFNVSSWGNPSVQIDGFAWSGGQNYDNARKVSLAPNSTGGQQFLNITGGNLTLVLHDPFRYPPPGTPDNFIDEVAVGWGAGLVLANHTQLGGTTTADTFTGELRWRNLSASASPETYVVILRLT